MSYRVTTRARCQHRIDGGRQCVLPQHEGEHSLTPRDGTFIASASVVLVGVDTKHRRNQ